MRNILFYAFILIAFFSCVNIAEPDTTSDIDTESSYTFTLNNTSGGSVSYSPIKNSYKYGDHVTINATASSGYYFSNWSGDATGSSISTVITITKNISITGNFLLILSTAV